MRRKMVLLAYSQGMVSRRAMAAAGREHVLCMAIAGDSQPPCTTLAEFISTSGEAIAQVCSQVVVVCDRQGVMGRAMLAIDGVKRPSHASKAQSGTRPEVERQAAKRAAAVAKLVQRHRANDTKAVAPAHASREPRQRERLGEEARKIRHWRSEPPEERRGPRGSLRQRNRPDNEAAQMATGKGVIQGDTGGAAVDEQHQSIVGAQAHGVGQAQELLGPLIEARQPQRAPGRVLTAEAGYHSAAPLAARERRSLAADIPDAGSRQRAPRVAAPPRHRDNPDPLFDKRPKPDKPRLFSAQAFRPAEDLSHGLCPAGKRRYRNGRPHDLNGFEAVKCTGPTRDGVGGAMRDQCLRHPQRSAGRQVARVLGRAPSRLERPPERLRRKVDSERGREMRGRRLATSAPVCGNLRPNKRLNRVTLRGRVKVDGQWKRCCLVHHIEQGAHHGYGG